MDNSTYNRIDILGIPVDQISMEQAVTAVKGFVDDPNAGNPRTVLAVNPEKIAAANKNNALRETLFSAGLLIPDGIGVCIASKLLGHGAMKRVPGSELMPELLRLAHIQGYSIFLLGAAEQVNEKVASRIRNDYPGIQIAGRRNGFDLDKTDVIGQINRSGAKILFVALGSPKQELWMSKNTEELSVKAIQGVGGTFDVLAGNVKRAPAVFRKANLEWFYRLITNPKRILRHGALLSFVIAVLRKKFSLDDNRL